MGPPNWIHRLDCTDRFVGRALGGYSLLARRMAESILAVIAMMLAGLVRDAHPARRYGLKMEVWASSVTQIFLSLVPSFALGASI